MISILALAAAQATQPAAPTVANEADASATRDHHGQLGNDIVVTGVRRSRADVLGGISVLSGEALARELRPTIGETLASQPGVSATSFGPNASRPIIRGLGGDRIRVLTDGIGSLDVSTSSADHAVAINPLTAQRIEVLRGPSALLFGSSAIGGVVNVIDNRIPRTVPDSAFHVDGSATLSSAARERSGGVVLDVPVAKHIVLHADASGTRTSDLRIGKFVLSEPLRRQAIATGASDVAALADLRDVLPNSGARSHEYAGAIAYIDGPLNVGVSVSRLANNYGVPVRYSLVPGTQADKVRLDLRQTRYDARAEVPLSGFLELARLRGGAVDYRHDELGEDGTIGSSFFSKGAEARLELVQRSRGGFGGAFGVQGLDRKVRIEGDEKFLPPNRTRELGVFALQNYQSGPWRAEVGGRLEFHRLSATADDAIGNPAFNRKYTATSGALGGSYGTPRTLRAGLNLTYSERVPSADELFANGPHGGTQAFEVGNPDFDKERSVSAELSLRKSAGPLTFGVSAYHTRFANFIYLAPAGEVEDDLPVYQYRQNRARFTGIELEVRAEAGTLGGVDVAFEGVADYVRAKVRGFGNAPQIPPLRLLGAIEARRGAVDSRFEVERAFAQRKIAPVETPTRGFTLLNASVNWRPLTDRPELSLGLSANNLLDVDARRHTSLLKDYAPLPGRDIRLTARIGF